MKFETKPLTLAQRVECSKVKAETITEPDGTTTVYIETSLENSVNYCKYGLKSLNGEEVTKDNFESLMMGLTNEEIHEIADKIMEETNPSPKK